MGQIEQMIMAGKLKVDYDWAYGKVVSSIDLTGISPEGVHKCVLAWMEGYVEGFLMGFTESRIKSVFDLCESGLSPECISKVTHLPISLVKKMTGRD